MHIDSGYILVYIVKDSQDVVKTAEKLSRTLKKKVIYVSTPVMARKKVLRDHGCRCDYSIYDWLYLFKNADFVVTNSFHGLAFSINFGKNVYVEAVNPNMKATTRISDLIERFGLHSRMIDGKINMNDKIDYLKINQVLEEERAKAMQYIDEIIADLSM